MDIFPLHDTLLIMETLDKDDDGFSEAPYEESGHHDRLPAHWSVELQKTIKAIRREAGKPGLYRMLRTQFRFFVLSLIENARKKSSDMYPELPQELLEIGTLLEIEDETRKNNPVDPELLKRSEDFLDAFQRDLLK